MSIQISFILIFFLTVFAMKIAAWQCMDLSTKKHTNFFNYTFKTPLFRTSSISTKHRGYNLAIKSMLYFSLVIVWIWLLKVELHDMPLLLKRYLTAPLVFIFTLWLGHTGQLLTLLTKVSIPDMHNKPYLAKSLNEFWSKRWNTWVRDWLRIVTRKLPTKNPQIMLFYSFFISGIFHEAMASLPYYLVTGKILFGYMMLYFFIQAVGFRIEKQYLQNFSLLKRIWTWFIIVGPSPLFCNEAFLKFFEII